MVHNLCVHCADAFSVSLVELELTLVEKMLVFEVECASTMFEAVVEIALVV